jgi:hypothetical protein
MKTVKIKEKRPLFILRDDFDAAVVRGAGISVELNSHGIVVVRNSGDAPVGAAVNDDARKAAVEFLDKQIGTRMEDGTVYAGISPDTGERIYALPADAPLTMRWSQAMEYAAGFEGHGKPKGAFRVPTAGELNVLFHYRAEIGGFNQTTSTPAGWYWSSTEHRGYAGYAWDQRFDDGHRGWNHLNAESSLRLVRS